jgi:hypothetical protein
MKTPRAVRRRRTLRKKMKGGAPDVTPTEMGYQLYSDIVHDFSAGLYTGPAAADGVKYYHNHAWKKDPRLKNNNTDENSCMAYFQEKPSVRNRLAVAVRFQIPKATQTFGKWTPPALSGIANGNDDIGIVQDAGDKITKALGAHNVITFGSILDPAGKPTGASDNPIWFAPSKENPPVVNIPLGIFGFDTTVLSSIVIDGFNGNGTCALFDIGDTKIDAVAKSVLAGGSCRMKPINITAASKVGYFVSINEAKKKSQETTNVPAGEGGGVKKARVQDAHLYLAGKTLGDTMLVASCMQTFNIPGADTGPKNIFYPSTGNGTWNVLAGEMPKTTPIELVLKTQDRLNHSRAIALGVPSILQSGINYVYVPGRIDKANQIKLYGIGYAKLRMGIDGRYDDLIKSFKKALSSPAEFTKHSRIGGQHILSPRKPKEILNIGAELIRRIVTALETLKAKVLSKYDEARSNDPILAEAMANPEAANEGALKQIYQATFVQYNKCAPTTTEIFDVETGVRRHIVVAVGTSDGPITNKLMIDLMTDFRGINSLQAPSDYDVKGEGLMKLFEEVGDDGTLHIAGIAPFGADTTTPNVQKEKAHTEATAIASAAEADDVVYVKGMTRNAVKTNMNISESLANNLPDNDGSLINSFVKYSENAGKAYGFDILIACMIAELRGNTHVIDVDMRNSILEEYDAIVGASKTGGANTRSATIAGLGMDGPPPNSVTILFNAFVCAINKNNSILPDIVGREELIPVGETPRISEEELVGNTIYGKFNVLEQMFLAEVQQLSRTGGRRRTYRKKRKDKATL